MKAYLQKKINQNIRLICFAIIILLPLEGFTQPGQCLAGGCSSGAPYGGVQSTTSTAFVNSVAGTWGGEYNTYNVTAGQQYEWSLCAFIYIRVIYN